MVLAAPEMFTCHWVRGPRPRIDWDMLAALMGRELIQPCGPSITPDADTAHMSNRWFLITLCLLLAACNRHAPAGDGDGDVSAQARLETMTSGDRSGAVSAPSRGAKPLTADVLNSTRWPPAQVGAGEASISCDTDYTASGDGGPLVDLDYFSVLDAMAACRERGVVRLRYRGKIDDEFTALVQRVAAMATRMDIGKRILDIDSSGGQVEAGIRAGDSIAESHWTIWVRDDSVCHSACVLILAAGDNRVISGKVGIHRIIRMSSTATSRTELNRELSAVHEQMKDYLARNGVDVAVADLMMTVPSRDLRLLTSTELQQYGLSGSNAAQDDLERIRLLRKCGPGFVHRKEAFARAFDDRCAASHSDVQAINACGRALKPQFGFPDRQCPGESPLSEYD